MMSGASAATAASRSNGEQSADAVTRMRIGGDEGTGRA
jgi:hypothetical protein